MVEERNKIFFTLGIIAVEEKGSVEFKTQMINKGVPLEVVAMKLRALLHAIDEKYFDSFSEEFNAFNN